MKIAFFGLLIVVTATHTTAQTVPTYFPTENSDGDGVDPFIIGGETLDRTVWYQSRRYLVDIKDTFEGELYHLCGATKISDRVVLTAARELIQYE
jgi:secreted trypsin-like serine protease